MPEPSARLYLVTPPLDDAVAFAPRLDEALAAGDVACVLLVLSAEHRQGADLKPLVQAIQNRDAAALVANDVALADRSGADGLHVDRSGALADALRRLKPARIVGAGGLSTRDDAMTAGESQVDYVMLGDASPDQAPLPFDERLDRIAWWAEIFQVPCVAVAYDLSEVAPFVAHGADFVAVSGAIWDDPRGSAAAVADATRALQDGHETFLARQAERV